MTITTTFRKCHEVDACIDSYKKMAKALGGITKYGRNTDTPVLKVLEVLGLEDALWVLGEACGKQGKTIARLWGADCAAHVLHFFENKYPNDNHPREAIIATRAFTRGEIDYAAWNAARAAAWDAARDAAGNAAWAAARAAARAAAEAAAQAAARAAARAAAFDAAWDAEREWQTERLKLYLTSDDLPIELPLPTKEAA
ncbi:MAG: hypothetical protein V3U60_16515 [Gammaproteobacteria bacterium]